MRKVAQLIGRRVYNVQMKKTECRNCVFTIGGGRVNVWAGQSEF